MEPRDAPTTSMLIGTVPLPMMSKHCTTGSGSSQPVMKKATAITVATSGAERALFTLMPLVLPFIMATPMV